jgi:hypothetical protein
MVVEIQPVEVDGQHWIDVSIGGAEMGRRGPFHDADEAEAMAERMRRVGRALTNSCLNGGSNYG